MNTPSWEDYFMTMAYLVASRSKDESTHIGAVIVGHDNEVISTGYNSFPRRIVDTVPERQERPEKYFWFEHAERNAIYNAARIGVSTLETTMYTNGLPCMDCARAVIQAGISTVVIDSDWMDDVSEKWKEHHLRTMTLFREAHIEVVSWKPTLVDIVRVKQGKQF